jgi:predicted transcriptional regulator
MILYLINSVNFPLSNSQLANFFTEYNYIDYMEFQLLIDDLVNSEMIKAKQSINSVLYTITDMGKQALNYMQSDISPESISDMQEFVENNKLKLMNESSSIANMVAHEDGYDVCLELVEKQTSVLTINVFIKDAEMARTLCENWKSKSSKVFDYILNELL